MTKFFSGTFIRVITKTEFSKLWFSQLLSQVSLHLVNFLIILRIFEFTGSSVAVSLVWLFYALPAVVLGPFSGTIIDLASRRKIIFAATAAQAIVALFYLPAQVSIWPIYTVIFVYALLNQVFIPAQAAMLPFLVRRDLLPAANTLFIFTVYASFLVGFGLAGPLVKAVGASSSFLLVSLLLAAAAFVAHKLPEDRKGKRKIRKPNEFWQRFIQGYGFIQDKPRVLFPLLLLVFAGILMPMIAVLAPAISVNILNIDLVEASTTLVLPAGIGALAGAITVVKFIKSNRKNKLITWGIFLASFTILFFAMAIPSLENKILAAAAGAFVLGLAFALTVIPTQTMLQEQTPDEMRGRVFGALAFLITAASILPVLFAATLAEFFGEIALMMFISAILFILGILSLNSDHIFRFYDAKK